MSAFQTEFNYGKCCSGFGQTVFSIIEEFTDTFDLLTRWVDPLVEGVASEALDVILGEIQVLLEPVNKVIRKVDEKLQELLALTCLTLEVFLPCPRWSLMKKTSSVRWRLL